MIYFSIKDIEKKLGITRNAVDKRIKRSGIHPQKINGRICLSKDEYEKILTIKTKKNKPITKRYFRVCVLIDDKWYVKRAGLSEKKADEVIKEYEEKKMIAIKKKC